MWIRGKERGEDNRELDSMDEYPSQFLYATSLETWSSYVMRASTLQLKDAERNLLRRTKQNMKEGTKLNRTG